MCIGGENMTEKNVNPPNPKIREKEKLREEFLKTVESKLRKEEKDIWFVKNHDHLKM